ncbi:prepilin-type N-terminal cleavage/methylation domain-containing protein [Pseudoduganella sp. OTU4001]|uniref:prepilin-type N-terminal cleavage/methylation domain-containing protein n=1 Tax=Pseudoduganella sp. OTU4001 TaxID=3043854 RepID=UPI00313BF20B
MRQLMQARQAGVTLIELMIGIGIMGFTLAIGVPSMSHWLQTNKAKAAAEFYADGLQMARRQALAHNARSRFVLSENAATGQYNWQVDICFPQPETACTATTGGWSTTTTAAANDPEGVNGYKSVYRSADNQPPATAMAPVLQPAAARDIYFTELGWVDPATEDRINSIRLNPGSQFNGEVPTVSLVVTLSGMTTKCDPTRGAGDSRTCPE